MLDFILASIFTAYTVDKQDRFKTGFMTAAYHPESVQKVQKVCQNLRKYE
jgi:hypothetical protein